MTNTPASLGALYEAKSNDVVSIELSECLVLFDLCLYMRMLLMCPLFNDHRRSVKMRDREMERHFQATLGSDANHQAV
jgi:hypothetical protein